MALLLALFCTFLCILSVHSAPKTKSTTRTTTNEQLSQDYRISDSATNNFTSLQDYPHFHLRRKWNLPSGTVSLLQDVTGEVELSWTKGNTSVKLTKEVTGEVHQVWNFGNVTIKIINENTGAVEQKWNLGKKKYHYERDVTGHVETDGTATATDRARFQREIDSWCQANSRFFPQECCVIYHKL